MHLVEKPTDLQLMNEVWTAFGCCLDGKLSGWWFEIFFMFIHIVGEMIQFDEHIFQMG